MLTGNDLQVQIIFCSKIKSDAFVGFLPEKANAMSAIRNIGFQLGYIEMPNSQIIFPDKNPDKSYYYIEFQASNFLQCQDSFFLAYNLQILQENTDKNQKLDFSFGKGQEQMANSNEANAGDVGMIGVQSFQQPRNDGTISTGAETPSFFGSEDQNIRQFRVRQLFRQKTPQEIQQLRGKANKIIQGNLIPISENTQQQLTEQAEGVIQDLLEHIHSHKKKIYKDKQLYLQ